MNRRGFLASIVAAIAAPRALAAALKSKPKPGVAVERFADWAACTGPDPVLTGPEEIRRAMAGESPYSIPHFVNECLCSACSALSTQARRRQKRKRKAIVRRPQ